MKRFALFLLSVLLLVGCGLGDGQLIRGSGKVVRESRPVDGAFTEIVVATSGNLTVIQGEERAIEVEAEENVLPQLTADVRNGTLTLGTKPGAMIQSTKPIRYTVTLPEIERLHVAGSGDIQSKEIVSEALALEIGGSGDVAVDALSARRLEATIDGSGSITVAGEVQQEIISINGSGNFKGQELVGENAKVDINGSGTTTLSVGRQLAANINGSGDIVYYGDPQIEEDINGSGDLVRRGGR